MLKAIMRVIRRVLAAVGRGLIKVGSLFGRGSAPAMPSPKFEEIVDEQVGELRQDLDSFPVPEPAPVMTLGARIHAYVAADAGDRAGFDLNGVPDEVALTLVSLTEVQLARLAVAGPVICGRWARGERTGLVGVPLPTRPTAPASDEAPGEHEGDEPAALPLPRAA